ncbi:hypothetical protein EHS25_003089 [Saitozyma podzolica]|uniref:Uncharacterized protein n=1 Tax=Saitozyma podzolica TaxID=1890683 RepID=A0A427YCG7_9TREE|nr:hypothetical protein EHS25_003089 [Saitozyma podzolica]
MNITWGDPRAAAYAHAHAPPHGGPQTPTPPGHRKLRKKVSFAPGHTSVYAEDTVPLTPSPLSTPIQTPSSTPLKPKSSVGVGGGLRSAFRRLGVRNPSPPPLRPPSPSGSDHSDTSWHHHDRYFPEYEPLYPTTKPFTDPFQYALTHEEVRRQHHQAVLGQSVALHYPDLPSWSEYTGEKGKDKSKVGWQSGRWGTEGWTGYGWDGETLPTSEGLTFGAPMPKGVAIVPPDQAQGGGGGGGGGGGKKKKKGKGGGGGAGMLRRPAAGMEKEETREGEETKTRAKRGSARGPNIGAKHADNDSDLGECEEDMRRAV